MCPVLRCPQEKKCSPNLRSNRHMEAPLCGGQLLGKGRGMVVTRVPTEETSEGMILSENLPDQM